MRGGQGLFLYSSFFFGGVVCVCVPLFVYRYRFFFFSPNFFCCLSVFFFFFGLCAPGSEFWFFFLLLLLSLPPASYPGKFCPHLSPPPLELSPSSSPNDGLIFFFQSQIYGCFVCVMCGRDDI